MRAISIHPLVFEDLDDIVEAFSALGWNKPRSQYEAYLAEQEKDAQSVLIARIEKAFAISVNGDRRPAPSVKLKAKADFRIPVLQALLAFKGLSAQLIEGFRL